MKKFVIKTGRWRKLLSFMLILVLFVCAAAPSAEARAAQTGEQEESILQEKELWAKQLSIVAKCVVLAIDAPDYDKDPGENSKNRDLQMAQLLKDYSVIEEGRGFSQVVITAHNGHAMKGGSSVLPSEDSNTMGDNINDIFDGSYFCIGTGFYEGLR